MSFIEQNTKVTMGRVSLADIPEYDLPTSSSRTFDAEQTAHEQRICFLTTATGEPIGTAAAWWGEDGAEWRRGRIGFLSGQDSDFS
jgi:hypothetical protein